MKNQFFAKQISLMGEETFTETQKKESNTKNQVAFQENHQDLSKEEKIERMKDLNAFLKKASFAYEQENEEIISNFEYDKLYDELLELEKETGIILSDSVTQNVGYEVSSKLEKVKHESRILSLDKTKDIQVLKNFTEDKECFLSWKLDGLTVVATYENGQLTQAVSRGNGVLGENLYSNFLNFSNIPKTISYKGKLVLRGEAILRYSQFEKINEKMPDEEKFKNPRNLCSSSVRNLDPNVTKERSVEFYPFSVIEGFDNLTTKTEKLEALKKEGFTPVEYCLVNASNIEETVQQFAEWIKTYDIPSDGLVLAFNDIAYSQSLGTTSKFPKDALAFKWQDQIVETTLTAIEWNTSRTGSINPVAIFEPVELEGTTVTRATLNNISFMEGLKLGIGDSISVFKSNMIIPTISDNLTQSNTFEIPKECPVCGHTTEIVQTKQSKILYCTNEDCLAKHLGLISHYVSRDAMNIDGLSEATFDKFIKEGIIHDLSSIYHLKDYKDKIVQLEGWGEKSYHNMIEAIEKSRNVDMPNFLYALGIPQVGRTASKAICKYFDYDFKAIMEADEDTLLNIEDIGPITATEIVSYMGKENNRYLIEKLLNEIHFNTIEPVSPDELPLLGLTFVVTGKVYHFANRNELSAKIESLGGKVSSSVSNKTDYLINNDTSSTSSKNKKAHSINEKEGKEIVKIISEEDFLKLI